MGMNMTEKILAKHAGLYKVVPGQLITCKLDMVLANDVTAPPSIKEFEKIGRPVFDRTKIALVPDHFTPNKDIKTAGLTKIVRDFAKKHKITTEFLRIFQTLQTREITQPDAFRLCPKVVENPDNFIAQHDFSNSSNAYEEIEEETNILETADC